MRNRTICRSLGILLSASLLLPLGGCGEKAPDPRGSIEDAPSKEPDATEGDITPTDAIPTMVDGDGTEKPNPDEVFDLYRELSDWSFTFSSGAGGWATSLYFEPDGSFHGDYHDSEMGSTGPGYDFGTVYTCNFTGTCNDYAKISDGIYRLHIDSLEYDPANVETIEDGAIGTVVAAAFAYLKAEVDGLKASLHDANVLLDAAFASLDAGSYKVCGLPRVLRSKVAGAPSAANVPDNWDPATMGVWTGVPRSTEQLYMDQASKKVYAAPVLTNSTNDWVLLN